MWPSSWGRLGLLGDVSGVTVSARAGRGREEEDEEGDGEKDEEGRES